ncbi:hypothetical protein LR004_02525, partial [Candidatus Gracilibacteria bacterium]|nr:hypothetical protein [Candidatus Gracilibacteria bacterium]
GVIEEVAKTSDAKMNENVSTGNSAEDIEIIKQADEGSSSLDTGYSSISTMNGIELFQNNSKDVSIIDVDLKYAGVSFGGLVQDEKFYKKYSAKEMEELTNRPDNIFGVVNGAFFLDVTDKKRTGLSFPIKSHGDGIVNDIKGMGVTRAPVRETFMDNEISKRTIVTTQDGNAKILEGYSEEYLNNPVYLELSVAFSPDVTARRDAKIGRSYIGLKCENDICKNIIFFVAENKTQADMDEIIADYGVERENIIMMDGGPSAQFSYIGEEKTFYGKWKVPQFNIIYEK